MIVVMQGVLDEAAEAVIACDLEGAVLVSNRRANQLWSSTGHEHHELLETARMSARHLRALLDDVLYLSRIEAGKLPFEHVLGVSAHAMSGDREACIAAGMSGYVTKPIKRDVLFERMVRAMSEVPHAMPLTTHTAPVTRHA